MTSRQNDEQDAYHHGLSLQRLPYEMMGLIAEYLDIDDIFELSLVNRHFQFLVREEQFCRTILKVGYLRGLLSMWPKMVMSFLALY